MILIQCAGSVKAVLLLVVSMHIQQGCMGPTCAGMHARMHGIYPGTRRKGCRGAACWWQTPAMRPAALCNEPCVPRWCW